jgi:hypothetical protein
MIWQNSRVTAFTWASALFGLAGSFMAIIATSKYGISHHSDSARYISVAQSVAAGHGFTNLFGQPEVWSNPLYPLLLALSVKVNVDVLAFARFLHASLFGATLVAAAVFFRSLALSRSVWIVAMALVLFSGVLFDQATTALTDMLFIFWTTLWLLGIARALASVDTRWHALATTSAMLAWLTRSVGITLVLTGSVLLLLAPEGRPLRARVLRATIFAVVASAPNVAWLVRNYLVSQTFVGPQVRPTMSPFEYFGAILQIIGDWIVPARFPSAIATIVGLLALICAAAAWVGSMHRASGHTSDAVSTQRQMSVRTAATFVLVYTAFVNWAISVVYATDYPYRYMAPAFIPLVGLLAAGAGWATRRATRLGAAGGRWVLVALVLCLVWPVRQMAGHLQYAVQHGAGGYATDRWQNSQLLHFVRANPPPEVIYSNEPNALYLQAGAKHVRWIPPHGSPGAAATPEAALRAFGDSLPKRHWNLLALFANVQPELSAYFYSPRDIESILDTELVGRFSDGAIYRVRPRSDLDISRATSDTAR